MFVLGTPFDLHVLGTPPAFILSQDQTLWFVVLLDQKPKYLKSQFTVWVFPIVLQKKIVFISFLVKNFRELIHS